jgi:hypothetical protein
MKALKTRRGRAFPAPILPTMQIGMDGDWRRYTRLLPKGCEVIGVVTIAGDDHGALVRLASTGAMVKFTGGEVTLLNQSRVRMNLELLERQQHCQALKMVAVDCRPAI